MRGSGEFRILSNGGDSNQIAIDEDCKSFFIANLDLILRSVAVAARAEINNSKMLAFKLFIERLEIGLLELLPLFNEPTQ